mmetsp:Transcript_4359/g.8648  ORF Transcript_4359/g.8648 Transcript_4359/m.8648 type:complete len:208 (+) Transcript_4359:43-666(+)
MLKMSFITPSYHEDYYTTHKCQYFFPNHLSHQIGKQPRQLLIINLLKMRIIHVLKPACRLPDIQKHPILKLPQRHPRPLVHPHQLHISTMGKIPRLHHRRQGHPQNISADVMQHIQIYPYVALINLDAMLLIEIGADFFIVQSRVDDAHAVFISESSQLQLVRHVQHRRFLGGFREDGLLFHVARVIDDQEFHESRVFVFFCGVGIG